MLALQQMMVFFIIMLVGYYAHKRGLITHETSKKISGIVVNIANPALILSACIGEKRISVMELLQVLEIAVGMFAVLILIAFLLPYCLKTDKKQHGIYRVMMVFSNIGFMGFPIISSLYGNDALLYASVFMIPFNVLIYTFGIQQIKGNADGKDKFQLKKIWNVGVVACLITLIICLTGIRIPNTLEKAITYLSNLTAPLSMMIIGVSLATISIREIFSDVRLLIFSAVKLLLIPIVGTMLIRQFVTSDLIVAVCMMMLATPVASMTTMLAQEYDGDVSLTTKGVALTTLLSVITIPIVSFVIGI